MTTVEKRVRDYFEDNCFWYNDSTIKAAAAYIEAKNLNTPEHDRCYTVLDWANDTKENNPEFFVTYKDMCEKGVIELRKQVRECIAQTDHEPTLEDFMLETQSDTFIAATNGMVTFEDLFRFLLLNYRSIV